MIKKLLCFLVIIAAIISFPQKAEAVGESGISVSPPFQEVVINPGEGQKVITIGLTNNLTVTQSFHLSVVDVGSLDELGGISLFDPNGSDSYAKKYGLAAYVTLDKTSLSLATSKTEQIRLTIQNKSSLTPGGHYAALLIRADQPIAGANVGLTPVLTSLILTHKVGGEVFGLKLDSTQLSSSIFLPLANLILRFNNDGNVHVIPRGIVRVTDPFGRGVSKGIINEDSVFILPETLRQIPLALQKEDSSIFPGIYQVDVSYRYVGRDTFTDYKTSYFYIGWPVVVLIFLLIASLFLLIKFRTRLRKLITIREA